MKDRQEILLTLYGEFMDLLACLSVYEGTAEPKSRTTYTDLWEALALR